MRPTTLACAILLLLTTGCVPFGLGSSPDGFLDDFAAAVSKGKVTDDLFVAASGSSYEKVVAGMGSDPVVSWSDAQTSGKTGAVTLTWHWTLPGSTWVYRTRARLARVAVKGGDDAWRIDFRPDLIEPSLRSGEVLVEQSVQPPRAEILGAGGVPLVTERPVLRVGLDKTKLPDGDAAALTHAATTLAKQVGIKVDDYVALAQKMGPNAFVPAIIYRRAELPPAVSALAAQLPAVLIIPDQLALAPTKDFAAPLLGSVGSATAELIQRSGGRISPGDLTGISGLQLRYDEQLAGSDGTKVFAVSKSEKRMVFSAAAQPGQPLATTLDPRLQQEADRLLAGVGPASALVAIEPSTGNLLAVANGPGSNGQNIATYGRYAPGSTFKMVTALLLLRAGLTPDSTVDCPATTTVDGKSFSNYPDYPTNALGSISLTTAIANSCNTAMIISGMKSRPKDLEDAAAALGFGVDNDLGFPAYFGEVPDAGTKTQVAADLIGQGQVTASPMAMATVLASIIAAKTVVPKLLPDHEVITQDDDVTPVSGADANDLFTMLRAVVTQGSGGLLKDLPGPPVLAKTGTAQYGTKEPYPTHAWMVASQGDLAVAVFVGTGESGSRTAGPIMKQFLAAANH